MTDRLRFLLPIGGILLVFALYSIYWFFASTQIRAAVEDWVSDQEAAGYVIEREALTVSGYPYRFQITFREPHITAPQSDGGWHAELASLQAHAVPYDLSHWIVRFGGPAFIDDLNGPGSQLELGRGSKHSAASIRGSPRELSARAAKADPLGAVLTKSSKEVGPPSTTSSNRPGLQDRRMDPRFGSGAMHSSHL